MASPPPVARSHAAYRAARHFDGLNGLRCCAIVAVVWQHCYLADWQPLKRGFLGVDLFFVLSGFLITTLLLRERDATGRIALGRFWVRRCLRLMPPLYLMLGALAVYYALHRGSPGSVAFFQGLPANALYLSNWWPNDARVLSILWSLATEEQFYLVWPLVEALLAPLAWPLLGLLMLANQALNFGMLDPWFASFLPIGSGRYVIMDVTYMPICLGVAVARILHGPRGYGSLRRLLGGRWAKAALVAALLVSDIVMPWDISGWPRLVIHLLMTALIASIVIRPGGTLVRVLEWRPVVRIGIVSYGLYLYHMWAAHAAHTLIGVMGVAPTVLLFPLTLAIGLILAEISYRLIESPALRLAHRFRPERGALSERS